MDKTNRKHQSNHFSLNTQEYEQSKTFYLIKVRLLKHYQLQEIREKSEAVKTMKSSRAFFIKITKSVRSLHLTNTEK